MLTKTHTTLLLLLCIASLLAVATMNTQAMYSYKHQFSDLYDECNPISFEIGNKITRLDIRGQGGQWLLTFVCNSDVPGEDL